MLNRVILIGRLTKDPELRYLSNGTAVTTFTLAVDRPFTKQGGEREADFINTVTWRQLAETCANYLKKGRLTAVEGRIQTRKYENNEGRTVYVTEVVADAVRFLPDGSSRENGSGNQSNGRGQGSQGSNQRQDDPFADDGRPIDISDDDLPF
jgi:single-strand DNA-binding protein